ncbi:hypothetical protein [Mycobacterium marseillense]|uniref:hypothetical protein n=1 Tax=Mycobacterium marseillense TaxID=701042 RepID=UPI00142DD5B9|nr:hypothetical protein [Mycobacterium marseillense]
MKGVVGHVFVRLGRLVVGLNMQNHLDIIDRAAARRPTFRRGGVARTDPGADLHALVLCGGAE